MSERTPIAIHTNGTAEYISDARFASLREQSEPIDDPSLGKLLWQFAANKAGCIVSRFSGMLSGVRPSASPEQEYAGSGPDSSWLL